MCLDLWLSLCFVVKTHHWVWFSTINGSILLFAEEIIENQNKNFTSADPALLLKDEGFCIGKEWGGRWICSAIQFWGQCWSIAFPVTCDLFLSSSLLTTLMPIDRVGFQLVWKYQKSVLQMFMAQWISFSSKRILAYPCYMLSAYGCVSTQCSSLKSNALCLHFLDYLRNVKLEGPDYIL